MRAGNLNDRVTLYKQEAVEQDEGFGASYDWVEQGSCWADVHRPHFNHGTMNGSAEAVLLTLGITIRPREVEKGWRVKVAGRMYDIIHIDTSDKIALTLTTQAVEVDT